VGTCPAASTSICRLINLWAQSITVCWLRENG
jgi:hypothetical protein